MTDRNDKLLLKLGWAKAETEPDKWPWAPSCWIDPSGEAVEMADTPRPYDNLQDAVDCVPVGWSVEVLRDTTLGHWFCKLVHHSAERPHVRSRADTPAEALASAIMKAVGNTRKEPAQ